MSDEAIEVSAEADRAADRTPPPILVREHALEFRGRAGEYFRIWIVNVALTIATLGIYAAWAKVRTRRYFYVSTRLAGAAFEYLANPKAILVGNLIVFGGFVAYNLAQGFAPVLSGVIVLTFYAVLPWFIWKALRFKAHNSSYRGLRFRFEGSLRDAYVVYLFLPMVLPFSLGLAFPWWVFKRRQYFVNNLAFGATAFSFEGTPGFFYGVYLKALLLLLVPFGLGAVVLALLAQSAAAGEGQGLLLGLLPLLIMLVFLVFGSLVNAFVYARVWNYTWANSTLGPASFSSRLKAVDLMNVMWQNMLAIAVSLGLLIPWARVRRLRCVLPALRVHLAGSPEEFAAGAEVPEGALGDAATEFFDFDVGF